MREGKVTTMIRLPLTIVLVLVGMIVFVIQFSAILAADFFHKDN
jgi:hypothetical protein